MGRYLEVPGEEDDASDRLARYGSSEQALKVWRKYPTFGTLRVVDRQLGGSGMLTRLVLYPNFIG